MEVEKGELLGVILNREFDVESSTKSQDSQALFNTELLQSTKVSVTVKEGLILAYHMLYQHF